MTYSPYRQGAIVQMADGGTGRINSLVPWAGKVGVICNDKYALVPLSAVSPIKVFVDESYLQALKEDQNRLRQTILATPSFKSDTPATLRWRTEGNKHRLRKLRETYDLAVAERDYFFGAAPTPEAVPAPRHQRWIAEFVGGVKQGWHTVMDVFRQPVQA
jgi:hypothetical protein